MNIGTKIKILASKTLHDMYLDALAGVPAIVVEAMYNKRGCLYGAWVKLPNAYNGEKEWFIPKVSLKVI